MQVPQVQVQPPIVGEQWLAYVKELNDESTGLITVQDNVNSYQHAQGFFQHALITWRTWKWEHEFANLTLVLQYFSYSYSSFCYGYFVIGYLFAFCCIAELICNKMRSSEINLYYFEMQLELSEIDLNYLKFIWKLLKLTRIICNSLGNF